MDKKQWLISDTEDGDFNLSRSGACFYFDKITENNFYWDFYHNSHYVGWLFKTNNEITNLEEFRGKER